jgi:hypothetical protein
MDYIAFRKEKPLHGRFETGMGKCGEKTFFLIFRWKKRCLRCILKEEIFEFFYCTGILIYGTAFFVC